MAIKIKNKEGTEPEGSDGDEGGQPGGVPPTGGMDSFERAGFRAAAWIEDNRSLFFALVGLVVLAAIGIVVGILYVRSQQYEASARVSEGLASYEMVVEGDLFLEQLRANEDVREPDNIFESEEQKWQSIYDSAADTLRDFDRGPIAVTARMVQAAASLKLEEYEEAESLYRKVIESDDATDEIHAFAHMGLANSLALQGDLSGAEEAWNGFAELQPERKAYADFEIARMIERYGEAEEARQRYEQFIEEHPDSPYLQEVERRQALL